MQIAKYRVEFTPRHTVPAQATPIAPPVYSDADRIEELEVRIERWLASAFKGVPHMSLGAHVMQDGVRGEVIAYPEYGKSGSGVQSEMVVYEFTVETSR